MKLETTYNCAWDIVFPPWGSEPAGSPSKGKSKDENSNLSHKKESQQSQQLQSVAHGLLCSQVLCKGKQGVFSCICVKSKSGIFFFLQQIELK
jgi:hypothetical protein